MTTDPTLPLQGDHRLVERLLEEIEKAEPAARQPLVDQLVTSLTAHMQLEEDVLYPVIADTLGEEAVAEAESEHELAKVGLSKVAELSPDGPGFGAAVEMVRAGIEHHVHEEEQTVFPQLNERLDQERQTRLDQDLDAARARLGLPTKDDMPDLSRDELYEKAQRAGVPGRSSMSKEELARAVPPEPQDNA